MFLLPRLFRFPRIRCGAALAPTLPALLALALLAQAPPLFATEAPPLQPEPRETLGPDRTADIEHLRLELAFDLDGGTVEGWARYRLRPFDPGVRRLRFHQVGLEVKQVRVEGRVAPFRLGDETLHISWEAPEPGAAAEGGGEGVSETLDVEIEYRATPTTGLHFRRPGKASPDRYAELWSQGEGIDNRHWFPAFDDPRDRFTYEGVFSAPRDLVVLSNGEVVETIDDPERAGNRRWHYALGEQQLVSYLVMVAAGPFTVFEDSWRGRPLRTLVPPGVDRETAELTVGKTSAMLDYFSRVTGVEYPYSSYSQVFIQRFLYTGMENTTATVMDRNVLHPERTHLLRWGSESVVAHELAHQWYGDLLTCRSFREMWLNEGFATYFAWLWAGERMGEDMAARALRRRYDSVVRADDRRPRPMVTRFFAKTEGDSGSNHPYSKGSSVLQMLRVMLGDSVFSAGIARYTQAHQDGLVESSDLRRAMEEVSGRELGWFFDQWVYLAGHPKLQVRHSLDADTGELRVTVKQVQEVGGLVPRFVLPVDLEVATSVGSRIHRLWMDEGETSLLVSIEGDLLYVAADPRGGLLADWDQEQSASEWVAQLSSPSAYARERAFVGLAARKGKVTDEEHAAIEALLAGDNVFLAQRATDVLGEWLDQAAVAILQSTLASESAKKDSDPRLRHSLVKALGRFPSSPGLVTQLTRLFNTDRVEQIRAEALRALSKLQEEGVRSAAFSALRAAPTDQMVLQRTAADVLGSYGSSQDLAVLARYRKPDTNYELRGAALRSSVRIVERVPVGAERKEARRPIARDLELMTEDLHLRARQHAVGLLGAVGDARSVRVMQALARRENAPDVLKGIDGAIRAIRSRDDREKEPTEREAEARLKALEERLDALEAEWKESRDRI